MKHTRTENTRRRAARRPLLALALAATAGLVLSACKNSDDGLPPLAVEIFNFSPNFAGVRLNAPLELTFTAPVDPSSVDPDSIRIFTTTTTTNEPDPGAPAIGEFVTNGNVVRFLPKIPRNADLSDAGLRIGFRYAVEVPAFPALNTVRTTTGKPVEIPFNEEFTTLNQTILPAPGDITAEPNLPSLSLFFIDEGIENGNDPCNRADLPAADRDSPQVVFTDPAEGEGGFGTITGIQPGLGTAFVRLDPLTLNFSEPIAPWRIRQQDVTIRNVNLDGKTFDIFLNFRQDRTISELQCTVFDSESAFDKASVPQGRYVLGLTNFSDLSGNPLINPQPDPPNPPCTASGKFQLSFATIASPTVPTDILLSFDDVDGDGSVDVGGLGTGANDPNLFPDWGEVPLVFLGGMATDIVSIPSPSAVTSSANWGNVAYWTGAEMRFDNGYVPVDMLRTIPNSLRLRGGAVGSSTAIMAPIAGKGTGPSDPGNGTFDGSVTVSDPGDEGKLDFDVTTDSTIRLFTGNAGTGPIVYHYRRFTLQGPTPDGAGVSAFRPVLTAASGSVFPLLVFVEDSILVQNAIITVDGEDGDFGFNGSNDQIDPFPRNPGGRGGAAVAGGGAGGHGGAFELGTDEELFNGRNGEVPANVLGTLDQLSQAVAGLTGMATGGGGHYEVGGVPDPDTGDEPVFQGGGGAGQASEGTNGSDACADPAAPCGQGVAGKQFGSGVDFSDPDVLASGGAGGGGGGAEDDDGFGGVGGPGEVDPTDDGGGGGGGGGGYIGLFCGGDITLGAFPSPDDANTVEYATIRAVGGAGGSTYASASDDGQGGLVPGTVPGGDVTTAIGEGEGGGGGGGGGITIIAGGSLSFNACEIFAYGKVGGNDPRDFADGGVAGGRGDVNRAGNGGGGLLFIADVDGFSDSELPPIAGGNNIAFHLTPDPDRDIDQDGTADIPDTDEDRLNDLNQMSGTVRLADQRQWGDDPREPMFGESQVVMDYFDTLSDNTSYDGVRVLSNIPRFTYDAAPDPDLAIPPASLMLSRTIRVYLDVTKAAGGLPDLSTEDPGTGHFTGEPGFTREIGLDYDADGNYDDMLGDPVGPQFESFRVIPPAAEELGKRFARVRIVYDLTTIGLPDELLTSFQPAGGGNIQVAPGNGLGNTDTAPEGVPAVADIRVTFTPGG